MSISERFSYRSRIIKKVVVIDAGSMYLKCGFSGEAYPRCIIPSLTDFLGAKDCDLTQEISPYKSYISTQECEVIVLDSTSIPTKVKNALRKALEELKVEVVMPYNTAGLALLSECCATGLVVDVGHWETSITPVIYGTPIIPFCTYSKLAGNALTTRLKFLVKHTTSKSSAETIDKVPPYIWEKIKINACLVKPMIDNKAASEILPCSIKGCDDLKAHQIYRDSISDYTHEITGEDFSITIPGWMRGTASEVLFEGYEDDIAISQCIVLTLSKCFPDNRRQLLSNLLVIGGTASLPGFKNRLLSEISSIINSQMMQDTPCHLGSPNLLDRSPFPENIKAWVGGNVFF